MFCFWVQKKLPGKTGRYFASVDQKRYHAVYESSKRRAETRRSREMSNRFTLNPITLIGFLAQVHAASPDERPVVSV